MSNVLEEKAKEFYRYFVKKDGEMPKVDGIGLIEIRDYLIENKYIINLNGEGYMGTLEGDKWANVQSL